MQFEEEYAWHPTVRDFVDELDARERELTVEEVVILAKLLIHDLQLVSAELEKYRLVEHLEERGRK